MKVYIGTTESSVLITAHLIPLGLAKPPLEKLAPVIMNKPPKIQTPAIKDGPIRFVRGFLSSHLQKKNVARKVNGQTALTAHTSRSVKL
jgi:hypothetical protein